GERNLGVHVLDLARQVAHQFLLHAGALIAATQPGPTATIPHGIVENRRRADADLFLSAATPLLQRLKTSFIIALDFQHLVAKLQDTRIGLGVLMRQIAYLLGELIPAGSTSLRKLNTSLRRNGCCQNRSTRQKR